MVWPEIEKQINFSFYCICVRVLGEDIKKTIFPESGRLFRKYAAGWNQL